MKTYLDCLPCFLRQALSATRMATNNEETQKQVLDRVMEKLVHTPLDLSPPEIARTVYRTIKKITKNNDPYAVAKQKQNKTALSLSPEFKEMIRRSEDSLFCALKLAIAGNIIDLGVPKEINNIRDEILQVVSSPLTINHYQAFRKNLRNCKLLLYLGDNAGEIVFDKMLIEELKEVDGLEIIFVVRERPVINDATRIDAEFVKMEEYAKVYSNGSDAPATVLSECSPAIVNLMEKADMIIAKGQGNYESLNNVERNIFFLLTVKCSVVARDLNVKIGSMVLKKQLI